MFVDYCDAPSLVAKSGEEALTTILAALEVPCFVTLNEDGLVRSHHFSCFAFGVCCAQVVLYMHVKLMCSFYDCRCGSKK
jgi:hypothetical protein